MTESAPLRFLLLAEGDAETNDSWSGSSKSIVDHLRRRGHHVRVGNVELSGAPRLLAAGMSFSVDRPRWRAKYLIGSVGFRLRSRRATHYVEQHGNDADFILQIGATFDAGRHSYAPPVVAICDSNIRMAQDPSALPYSEAGLFRRNELAQVEAREADFYRSSAAVLTLSERARRSFIEDFSLPPSRVTTIWAGPNAALPIQAVSRRAVDSRILFVGKQFERKGGDILLAAFRELRSRVPHAELWIAGPEPRSAEPGVRWLGFLNQASDQDRATLAEAFQSATVYCLPTRFEPLGISFIEAMHLAIPCVGTNVWAVPEMIVDGETGFVVPVNDHHTLADRLQRLLSEPALAARMGEAGRRRAQDVFTWDHAIERLLAVVGSIPRASR